jgi:hypothetical protein
MENYMIADNQVDSRGRVRTARRRDAQTGQSLALRRTWFADPTSFSYQLLDDEGLSSNNSIFVAYDGATETVDALIGAWTNYGGLLDAVVDGKIVEGSITIPLIRNGSWKAAPIEGNNVNQVMNLNFDNDFNSYATSILLPSYKESILTPAGLPDLVDPALAAYIAGILGGYLTQVFPNSRDLHDLNALRDAFLTVRKVRNQKRGTIVRP